MSDTDPVGVEMLRTVTGDIIPPEAGYVYAHEHLIIDSPLIESKFPDIHLHSVSAAVEELSACVAAGLAVAVDCMPCSAGRDARRLAAISQRTGAAIVAATGLHHDRYYGDLHWTNHVSEDELAELFVADVVLGIDEFDYTGPIVRRTESRAGVIKVATSGARPDGRDLRNLRAAAQASVRTGAPVLTHCEGGTGGVAQVEQLIGLGVAAGSIILSHVDKARDLGYLNDLASTGAVLELDQGLRDREHGIASITVRAIFSLVESGFSQQIAVGTDGARRTLWSSLGGAPGLAWLATELPPLLRAAGIDEADIHDVMGANALRALRLRPVENRAEGAVRT